MGTPCVVGGRPQCVVESRGQCWSRVGLQPLLQGHSVLSATGRMIVKNNEQCFAACSVGSLRFI